jgi:hypothetical protein
MPSLSEARANKEAPASTSTLRYLEKHKKQRTSSTNFQMRSEAHDTYTMLGAGRFDYFHFNIILILSISDATNSSTEFFLVV